MQRLIYQELLLLPRFLYRLLQKKFCLVLLLILQIVGLYGQSSNVNLALHLDGKDNNVRTGIGIISAPWTIEAWIKGDDFIWKQKEVIVGGGEYSKLNIADGCPLEISNGKVLSKKAGLSSTCIKDTLWHHIALTCSGKITKLYLDGIVQGSKNLSFAIIPGAIGVDEGNDSSTFGGLIDEVRIWQSSLSQKSLNNWKSIPLNPHHPSFSSLLAYYNFDDGFENAMSINWVGKGIVPFHLRNGRCDFRGNAPLAYTIPNTNRLFHSVQNKQAQLFGAVVVKSEWDVEQGKKNEEILKLRVTVTGGKGQLALSDICLNQSLSTRRNVSQFHLYYAGKTARSQIRQELFRTTLRENPKTFFVVRDKPVFLQAGIHYFLVTADVSPKAKVDDTIDFSIPSFRINGTLCIPDSSGNGMAKKILPSRGVNSSCVKVLQWNVWHGGVHLGNDGVDRIIQLIRSTNADIVTMQEAYGSQTRIKDSLGFYMKTPGVKANLALFSRFPISALRSQYNDFNSNPAVVHLPMGDSLLVDACWLRYASNPEYTSIFPNKGLRPFEWIKEDSALSLKDIDGIVQNDIEVRGQKSIPIILGGDFNSCSHLDWTKTARFIHSGYGPIAFPTSRYLNELGYKDSYRETNQNEVDFPGGTWAVIYGQLRNCRIDFLYYKGDKIQCLTSKIIRTTPEIDDVWPSDHGAVLSTFILY